MNTGHIYLDNNSTTMMAPEVLEAMLPYLRTEYGNPNSLHSYGLSARNGLRTAIDQIYAGINASDDDDILMVGCATEANNTVLKSILRRHSDGTLYGDSHGRTHIVTSTIEHPCIRNTCEYLETQGIEVTYVPVNSDGIITPEAVKAAIDPRKTALVSIMWANNETGLVNPIAEIAKVVHEAGCLFHTDAVQAVGKIPVDVQAAGVDMLTMSAHKFHGPKGVGALYVRAGCHWLNESDGWFVPLLHGGEQMSGRRAGTINVAGIVGMGKAIELTTSNWDSDGHIERITALRNKLEDAIAKIPGVTIIGKRELRTPNTILASFKGVEGEALLWDLNEAGIAASTGSACASESLQANPTFVAMSIDPELSHTGIRFSLSRYTTEEEIDKAIVAVNEAVKRLRIISGQIMN